MFTLQDLLNAGLPATSTDGDKQTQFSRELSSSEWLTYLSIADANEYQFQSTLTQLRNEYLDTISQLETIQNTANPTNAQVVAAVKYLAGRMELLLKFLKKQYQ